MLRKFIDYYKNHISDKILDLVSNKQYIYILGINKKKNIFKVGRTENIRKRLYAYATGLEKHPDILFILIVDNPQNIENCVKLFADKQRNNKEQYNIDFDLLKKTIFTCASLDKEILEKTSDKSIESYIVYDNSQTIDYINLNGDTIGHDENFKIEKSKKIYKKLPKKTSKKLSKKTSKKLSKKTSKKLSKKTSKKSFKKDF